MTKNEILKKYNIPENLWDYCIISDDGTVYTPEINVITNEIIRTAQEIIDDRNKVVEKELTTEEILSKEVAKLKISDMKKDTVITGALQTIASLKIEIMNLKGAN